MSKPRKSFLLHFDSLGILDKLTKEQAGELFLACRDYNLGKELSLDSILELVFFSFKSQFDRDIEKYNKIVERNKNNGSKGGRPETHKNPQKPTGLIGNPSKPKKADNNSVNDNNSDSNNKVNNIHQLIVDEFNIKLPELGKVKVLSDKRKAGINGVIKQFKPTEHNFADVNTWSRLFGYIEKSDFLMGRSGDWSAGFDFITNKSNMIKIIEGQYDNK